MSMEKLFKAVLFDMDGTVADTMPYHFISWFEVLGRYGVRAAPMFIFETEGLKWDKIIKRAFRQSGGNLLPRQTVKKIIEKREQIFNRYFKRSIFAGMPEFIKSLKNKSVLVGLVTGSSLKEVKNILPEDIYELFDIIIAGDMVKRGKPYPEPYLTAAKNLKISPEMCAVIENSPLGIKAAKAAKMYCCGVSTSLPKALLSEADIIFDSHQDLYKYFNNLLF